MDKISVLTRKVLSRIGPRAENRPPSLPAVWSEYLNWLSFANAGMMERGNVACFDYAIRNLPSQAPIVEIGSFCGLSTNTIAYLKARHGAMNPLVTCDKWVFERTDDGKMLADSKSVTHEIYREFVKRSFIRNAETFSSSDLPHTVEAFSDEFFDLWKTRATVNDVFGRSLACGGPISFCYIDGNHSYAFAKRDFENCDCFLESGGFVLFDDSADGSGWEVCAVVKEVVASGKYELIAKNPNYFFRKL